MLAALDALKIKCTADNMVTHTWKIWHTTTANKHNCVLLKVMAFTADVSPYFLAIGKAYTSNLT